MPVENGGRHLTPLLSFTRFEPDYGAPPLRVAIDATSIRKGRKGLGRFQRRLVEELLPMQELLDIDLLVAPDADLDALTLPPQWRVVRLRSRRDLVRNLIEIPRWLRAEKPRCLLTTTDRLRKPAGLPVVLYVFEHPIYRSRLRSLGANSPIRIRASDRLTLAWFSRTLARATLIVAASTSTARDLLFFAGVSPARLSVALPGPFLDGTPDPTVERQTAILAFIDNDLRDNGVTVLDAFSAVPSPWTLEVVGDTPVAIQAYARAGAGADRVRFHGRVDDVELRRLMTTSSIYLDLSLFEGFGAQASEALEYGLRPVVSWVNSLPEVVGSAAALLVNPHQPEEVGLRLAELIANGLAPPQRPVPSASAWRDLAAHLTGAVQRVGGHSK